MKPTLTEDDHDNLSRLLARVLEAHAADDLSTSDAVSGLAHLIAAIDIRNVPKSIHGPGKMESNSSRGWRASSPQRRAMLIARRRLSMIWTT